MCLSPDQMSDDRIREAIDYYREVEAQCAAEGDTRDERYFAAKAADFEALLAEREAVRATEITEIGVPVFAEVAGQRELVSA